MHTYTAPPCCNFSNMEACFWPARWNLKTVSLLQTTLQKVQVLTALAAAPPCNTFILLFSNSCWVSAFFLIPETPLLGFSGGPMTGLVVVVEVVAPEAADISFSTFFKCFLPNLCLYRTSPVLHAILHISHQAD
ncbi:hypothetical protein Hanom_Chr14g01305671 [Helianthus anomalus]